MESKSKVAQLLKVIQDKVREKNKEYFPIRKRTVNKFKKVTLRKIKLEKEEGILLVIGKLKVTNKIGIQSVLFDLSVWKKNTAKQWYINNKEKMKKLMEVK